MGLSGNVNRLKRESDLDRKEAAAWAIPAGYRRSEVGVVPCDWDVVQVSDVARVRGGKRLPAGFVLSDQPTPYPYLRVADMVPGGVDTRELKYVPEAAFPAIRNYRINSEDIFISVAGTLGIVGVVPESLSGANLTENADRITDIRCHREYLMYWLMSETIQSIIDSIRTVGAQPKLALGRIARFHIVLPSRFEEQRAIAEALSDMDRLLAGLDALVVKKRGIKLATMQQLLTGRTRLPGFSGEWELRPLYEVTEIRKGDPITASELLPGNVPVIAGGKVPAGYHAQANRKSPCVTVSASGASAGFVALHRLPIFASDCSTIQGTAVLSAEFAFYQLVLRQDEIYGLQSGGAQPHVQPKDLASLYIPSPAPEEQHAITSILADMDVEIDTLVSKREKTHMIKQGMMQQLLTGRVRLVHPEATA